MAVTPVVTPDNAQSLIAPGAQAVVRDEEAAFLALPDTIEPLRPPNDEESPRDTPRR